MELFNVHAAHRGQRLSVRICIHSVYAFVYAFLMFMLRRMFTLGQWMWCRRRRVERSLMHWCVHICATRGTRIHVQCRAYRRHHAHSFNPTTARCNGMCAHARLCPRPRHSLAGKPLVWVSLPLFVPCMCVNIRVYKYVLCILVALYTLLAWDWPNSTKIISLHK